MQYLPHLIKSLDATKQAAGPAQDAVDQLATLRGYFMGDGSGSPVCMESAMRSLLKARKWINAAIDEAKAAEAVMPDTRGNLPDAVDGIPPLEIIPAGFQPAGFQEVGRIKSATGPRLAVNNEPRPAHSPDDPNPPAAA